MIAFGKTILLVLAASSVSGKSIANIIFPARATDMAHTLLRCITSNDTPRNSVLFVFLLCAARGPPPPASSPDVNGPGSSPSAVATKPLEGLVKVLNHVPVEGGDVDVEDELRTTASSNNSEDLDVIARVKVGGLRASAGNSCLGSGHNGNQEKYSPKRDGKSYNFNIFAMDAECLDADNLPYEWGEFQKLVSGIHFSLFPSFIVCY